MSSLKVGEKAPDFNLPAQDGIMHALKDYAGQWVLLYFYPKDDTPGCTTEACALRDNLPKFKKLYDVYKPKKFMGQEFLGTMRESFLIDTTGKIAKIYEDVKPADHADEVLADLSSLQK